MITSIYPGRWCRKLAVRRRQAFLFGFYSFHFFKIFIFTTLLAYTIILFSFVPIYILGSFTNFSLSRPLVPWPQQVGGSQATVVVASADATRRRDATRCVRCFYSAFIFFNNSLYLSSPHCIFISWSCFKYLFHICGYNNWLFLDVVELM